MCRFRPARFPKCVIRARAHGGRMTSATPATRWRGERSKIADHTQRQIEAITALLQLFVAEDLASGISLTATHLCNGCGRERPAPGFVRYDSRTLCNACAIEHEVRRALGLTKIGGSVDPFRGRHAS